ncbi:hypothetical protein [Vibrio taketomensis]|uniref:hypothetical protein n=1 Tax=Vibrio taketomensis TaxID=2572923 RepID=UPI001E42D1F1|nr:hypothetical protein [Vibrio taketomensis]
MPSLIMTLPLHLLQRRLRLRSALAVVSRLVVAVRMINQVGGETLAYINDADVIGAGTVTIDATTIQTLMQQ